MRRLTAEINYWDARHGDLLEQQQAGKSLKIRPETAFRRARDLEGRLERRLAELDGDSSLRAEPPRVEGAALVVPRGWIDRAGGQRTGPVAEHVKDTKEVERRAVDAVLAASGRWAGCHRRCRFGTRASTSVR